MTLFAITEQTWIAPIIQFGVGGGVLVWFMFQSEPRLRAIEAAIDRMARAILLLVISIPGAASAAKEQAEGIKKEIEEAEINRKK
jgi:hypothetical protein